MTTNASNPTPFPPIDEGDFLALVEGISIPAERAAKVREALATDPRLAELAALMRADREAVASLPAVSAPSDLLDRVEAQLEREALVGLAQNERAATTDTLPISTVIPARKVWMTRRVGAPLAAAAAVALISGGVLMMIPPGKKPVVPQPVPEPIATNDKLPVPANNNLANSNGEGTVVDPEIGPGPTPAVPVIDVAAKPPTDPVVPSHTVIAKSTPAMSNADLLAAASEGRLVLRVRADDQAAKTRVDAMNANARTIRIDALDALKSNNVTMELADAIVSRNRPVPPVKPVHIPEPAPLAGPDSTAVKPVGPVIPPDAPVPAHADPAPELSPKAYLALVPAAAESLESLRKSMGTDAVQAEWYVLPRGVRFDPPSDAQSILWWTAPPAAWSNRFSVPVVVQHN